MKEKFPTPYAGAVVIFKQGTKQDLNMIMEFYWNIIDGMKDSKYPTKWKKGIYPDEDSIKGFLERGEYYILSSENEMVGGMALNHSMIDEYKWGNWKVSAKDKEVLSIHALGVAASWQGQGIGQKMIDKAISVARDMKQKAIRLDTLYDNIPAQHLYEGKGFELCGKTETYYKNTGDTTIYLYEYEL